MVREVEGQEVMVKRFNKEEEVRYPEVIAMDSR